jgi:hypothetical protein
MYQQTQGYGILAEVYDSGPHVYVGPRGWIEEDWFMNPPYSDGGGATAGENPVISVTEFYVTPYDRFVWNSPEESVVSELYRGKNIGFAIGVVDVDAKQPSNPQSYHYLRRVEAGTEDCFSTPQVVHCADGFCLGLLVGPGGETPDISAIESVVTWGRIKMLCSQPVK